MVVSNNENIFVAIPSYRENDCSNTLHEIYKNASCPEKVFCGIFLQIDHKDPGEACVVDKSSGIPRKNLRYMVVNHEHANGPLQARCKIFESLYKNEKYMLWIDSHTHFVKDWDKRFKSYLNFLKNKKRINKPILAGYPADYNNPEDATYLISVIDDRSEISGGVVPYPLYYQANVKPPGNYYKGYFIAAGCMFTYGSFYNDALGGNAFTKLCEPLGPIFNGEELLISLLAYVSGWEIYSIPYSLIRHKYKTFEEAQNDKAAFKRGPNFNQKKELEKLVYSKTSKINRYGKTVFDFYDEIGWNHTPENIEWAQRWTPEAQHKLNYKTRIIKYD